MSNYQLSFSKFVFCFYFFSIICAFPSSAGAEQKQVGKRPADFRLIVTGGLLGIHDGEYAFLQSPLFRLGDVADDQQGSFVINNAEVLAYRSQDTVYYSQKPLNEKILLEAKARSNQVMRGTIQGMAGAQVFGFAINGEYALENMQDSLLRRELGGVFNPFRWEIRRIGDVDILAIDISNEKAGVYWPETEREISEITAVMGLYPQTKKKFLFFPRAMAATPRVFGIVDQLMKQSDVPTRYLDIGNALVGIDNESINRAKEMRALLLARKPVVLGASRYDLSAIFQDKNLLQDAPYIVALKGESMPPSSIATVLGKNRIQFSALGEIAETAIGFLPKGIAPLTIAESIQRTQTTAGQADIVIGLTDNNDSAGTAIASPVFDAVLSLVSGTRGALPSNDDISLEANYREGLSSVAPLVRVSSADVTEVFAWTDAQGQISRLEIRRHAVVDNGPEAEDAKKVLESQEERNQMVGVGLPSRPSKNTEQPWGQSDFDAVLGGILLETLPDTELAIIDQIQTATPIYSSLSLRLAQSLLQRPGRAVWLSLRGKYIKRILKAAKEKQLGVAITLVGGSFKGPTIGQREIVDTEKYRIVVTEKVLLAVDDFMAREGLFAASTLAASSLQTAMFEGNKEALKILSEIRRRDSRDDPSIGERRELLVAAPLVAEIVRDALLKGVSQAEVSQFLKHVSGKIKPTFIFDVSDLDFGIKLNRVNDVLLEWQTYARQPGSKGSFTEPRFWDQNYLNMLIYAKAGVKYVGPTIDAELMTNIKYFQPNSENLTDANGNSRTPTFKDLNSIRPAKDSVKIEGEIRVPLERVLENPPNWLWSLGLIGRLVYETQIWPQAFLTNLPREQWPHRVNDSRLFLGMSAKPNVGEEMFRLGGVVGYDLSRDTAIQSFAYGAEIAGAGRWNVSVFTIKLESSLRKMIPITTPELGRMGLIWLADGKIELPIYGGFSVSALLNFTLGARMDDPWRFGTGAVFGLALSYGNRFKWLL